VSINSFLSTVAKQGGMSFSNNFTVKLVDPPVGISNDFHQFMEFMCDEAQLPNTNTADGNMVGVHLGLGSIRYPHTRVFTEVQLSFMLDANLEMLKFFQGWQDYIFDGRQLPIAAKQNWTTVDGQPLKKNRPIRLNYMDDYVCDIEITKTEIGPKSTTERRPITYVLERAYPYAIDAVPLQFGSAQITKLTVQLTYERHYTIVRDIKPRLSAVPKKEEKPVPTPPPKTVPEQTTGPVNPREAARQRGLPPRTVPWGSTYGPGSVAGERDTATGVLMNGQPEPPLLMPDGSPVRTGGDR
jgi:hypothetical protein